MIDDFVKKVDDDLHLLIGGEVTVIHDDGIFGLFERRFCAMRVAVIAIVDIRQNGLEIRFLSFGYQFIEAALCTHFGDGGEEEFEFCFR